MTSPKLLSQIAFIKEADKMKNVLRQTLIADGSRQETDAEHSWHFALTALTLYEYASSEVNLERVLKMALLHDMVEIYAGDTFAFDDNANSDKEDRENKAADKLFGLLPSAQGKAFRALWEEFDEMQTPDALFAAAVDRFGPFLNNYLTNGHTWKLGDVPSSKVYKRIEPVRTAIPELWDYVVFVIEDSIKKGYLKA